MAKKKPFQKKKIQDTAGSGFGQYKEGVGGGASPNGKSSPADHGHGVNSDYRQDNNETMQPRTGDGKFTYKSVNGESIDPKYGPSRGKTVNPLLTGGQNGIMIDDVVNDFAAQQGNYWDKYKDSWYQKGSEVVTTGDFKVHVSAEAIWDVAKRKYDKVKGEFEGEHDVFGETKKGRRGKEEKAAIQKAVANDSEQGVINQSTGGLKLKPGIQPQAPQPKSQAPQPKPGIQPTPTPIAPGAMPTNGAQKQVSPTTLADIANADYSPKYSDSDIADVRGILQEQGFTDDELSAFDALSPKEKDEYIDKNFDQGGDDQQPAQGQAEPSGSDDSEDEDSETTKKIKQMGFSA